MTHDRFELRRLADGLVYVFTRKSGLGRAAVYERADGVVRVAHDDRYGWSIRGDTGDLLGRVWDTLPEDQGDHPKAGAWVNRKDDKADVYALVYGGG